MKTGAIRGRADTIRAMAPSPFRTLAALTAATALLLTGCGDDDSDTADSQTETSSEDFTADEDSVETFYAQVVEDLKAQDFDALCDHMADKYEPVWVSTLQKYDATVEDCQDAWGVIAQTTSISDLDDPVSDVEIDGNTALMYSGDDPWSLEVIDGRWQITAVG